jgi:hypothetical protein
VYSIQKILKRNVSDFRQVVDFHRFPSPKKTDHHDVTDILLKVALNTMTQTLIQLTAITFRKKHEVLLCCYLPLHKIQNTNTMTVWKWKQVLLSGLVNVIVYLDDFRSEEEIRKCVRCFMSGLVDGMVNENVGNVKE